MRSFHLIAQVPPLSRTRPRLFLDSHPPKVPLLFPPFLPLESSFFYLFFLTAPSFLRLKYFMHFLHYNAVTAPPSRRNLSSSSSTRTTDPQQSSTNLFERARIEPVNLAPSLCLSHALPPEIFAFLLPFSFRDVVRLIPPR